MGGGGHKVRVVTHPAHKERERESKQYLAVKICETTVFVLGGGCVGDTSRYILVYISSYVIRAHPRTALFMYAP